MLTLHADADGCRGGVIQWAFDYVTLNDGINTAPVYPYVGQASALEYVVGLCLFLETSVRLEALLQFLTRNGLYGVTTGYDVNVLNCYVHNLQSLWIRQTIHAKKAFS